MLKKVKIENLKGIKNCEIKDLALINLFIGKNNSCKSTILESIYYGLSEFSPRPSLLEMLKHRTDVFVGGRELWFNQAIGNTIAIYYEFENNAKLELKMDFEVLTQQIACRTTVEENNIRAEYIGSSYSSSNLGVSTAITINKFDPKKKSTTLQTYIDTMFFLESKRGFISGAEVYLSLFKVIGRTREFGKYLQKIYGIGKEWEFVPSLDNSKEFRASAMVNELPYLLSGLGDGMKVAVPILAVSIINRNSAILVEEIESNQHPAALKGLLIEIVKLCIKNNIQLFLTTHSLEVNNILYYDVFEGTEERAQQYHCYFVDRNIDSGNVTCEEVITEEKEGDHRKVAKALLSSGDYEPVP